MKKYLFIALMAFLAVTSASAQLRIKMGKNSPIEKLGRAEIAITNLYAAYQILNSFKQLLINLSSI